MRSILGITIFIAFACGQLLPETPLSLQEKPSVLDPTPPILPTPVRNWLSRDSAQIFSGTVLKIEHRSGDSSSLPTTQISFRVEHAIRGVQDGQVINIKEWGGLWHTGERYHPGERVLLFLYPPSRLGLTSPVGGRTGRFAVDNAGYVLLKNGDRDRPNRVEMRRFAAGFRQAEEE